jgi:hypothetical protein
MITIVVIGGLLWTFRDFHAKVRICMSSETCGSLRVGGVGPPPLRFTLIRMLRKGMLREGLHQAGEESSLPQLSILRRRNADFSLESLAKGYF